MSSATLNSRFDFITSTRPSDYITPTQATHLIPKLNGVRVSVSTIHRWIQKGVGGIHLTHWRVGRKIVITEAALQKFFTELAEADAAKQSTPAVPRKRRGRRRVNSNARQKEIDAANEVLIKAGILTPQQDTNFLKG